MTDQPEVRANIREILAPFIGLRLLEVFQQAGNL